MGKKRGAGLARTRYAAFRGADFSTDPSLVESCRRNGLATGRYRAWETPCTGSSARSSAER